MRRRFCRRENEQEHNKTCVGNRKNEFSVKGMLQIVVLKDREYFLNNVLNPSIKEGFVRMHPIHLAVLYIISAYSDRHGIV